MLRVIVARIAPGAPDSLLARRCAILNPDAIRRVMDATIPRFADHIRILWPLGTIVRLAECFVPPTPSILKNQRHRQRAHHGALPHCRFHSPDTLLDLDCDAGQVYPARPAYSETRFSIVPSLGCYGTPWLSAAQVCRMRRSRCEAKA